MICDVYRLYDAYVAAYVPTTLREEIPHRDAVGIVLREGVGDHPIGLHSVRESDAAGNALLP